MEGVGVQALAVGLLQEIESSWGWTGIRPAEVVGENDFGNLVVRDVAGRYWRICPEDLYCRPIAQNRRELDALSTDQAFLHDWYARALVAEAVAAVGPLGEGRKYCLKIPGPLGGKYSRANMASISLLELIRASGDVARQIDGLPNGARVRLRVTE